MAQRDYTAEALQRGATPGRGYVIAQTISQILHPIFLSIISFLIIGLFALPGQTGVGLAWGLLCIAIQIIPPTIFFIVRMRQGAYTDEDVSVRSQRNELYLFSFVNLLVGTAILALIGTPLAFLAVLLSAMVLNITSWLINLSWKISVHAAGMGSCATIAVIYSQPLGLFFWGCAALLGWARVRTRNHTPMQVVAGLTLAAVCVLGSFAALGLLAF